MKHRTNEKYYRIINAATKVFAKKGFYQAKVSEIAKEAKVADGTIYLYFKNKDDILISLFEEQIRHVLENMKEQISKEKDAAGKIQKFALSHLKLIEQNKDMAEIIQVELRQSSKFIKEYKNEQFVRFRNSGQLLTGAQTRSVRYDLDIASDSSDQNPRSLRQGLKHFWRMR